VVAAELELDGAGRAVAVLRYVELGDTRLLITFVVLGPIKKHDNVSVLFYAVVDYNITRNEVVEILDRQVVNVLDSVGVDLPDAVPIHVTRTK